jgi:Uma2 family endonuclease
MVAARVPQAPVPIPPQVDQRVILSGVNWLQFEAMLAIRGDQPVPRMTYLHGELELMSPSRNHETLKKLFARLLEAYADVTDIELQGYGSMTMRNAPRERGVEPDECYAVGAAKEHPDLAIEVIWTSGGIDKLDVYRGLGVREVWLWREEVLSIHILKGERCVTSERSEVLPELDLALLASFLKVESQTQAVRQYRAALRGELPSK